MKFGIISDLHLNFDRPGREYHFTPEPGIFYLNAGDTNEGILRANAFHDIHDDYMFSIYGNHDHYSHDFFVSTTRFRDVNGLSIVGATLWTHMENPLDFFDYATNLVDYRYTPKLSYEKYRDAHEMHKEAILTSGADVIVTHHAPTKRSIHDRYKDDDINKFFCNDYEDLILSMPNPPKLWVHGHVHDSFDYMVGNTRVVANPRGYPGEANHKNYAPKIVEI